MEKSKNKKKGIWISFEIMNDKKLDWNDKALLSEIISLHSNGSCYASNEYFSEFLGLKTKSAASKKIKKLKNLGYIGVQNHYKDNQCTGRTIIPLKFENCNINQVETFKNSNNGSSNRKENIVPKRMEGTSKETIEVVPNGINHTSCGNTINTIINKENINKDININTGAEEIPLKILTDIFCNYHLYPPEYKNYVLTKNDYRRVLTAKVFMDFPDWENKLNELGKDKFIPTYGRYLAWPLMKKRFIEFAEL